MDLIKLKDFVNRTPNIVKILALVIFLLLAVRVWVGGNEDDWICQGGEWVQHGSPNTPKPTTVCK